MESKAADLLRKPDPFLGERAFQQLWPNKKGVARTDARERARSVLRVHDVHEYNLSAILPFLVIKVMRMIALLLSGRNTST